LERVKFIGAIVAALHFIAAPRVMDQIDGRDMLQIKALGGVLEVLSGFVKHAEDTPENVHEVAVKTTSLED
jgi:hypothetical protein